MQQIPDAAGMPPGAMYRDLANRRWLRAFLFHLLAIGPFLFLWAAPLVLRAGLLPSLFSFFSLRLYLAFAIFDLSQLLFVLARRAIVVADAPPLPSSASLLARIAGLSGAASPGPLVHQDHQIRATHGESRAPVSQWEVEAAWATLSGRARFVSLCAAAGSAGAISLSLFRAQLLGDAPEIESSGAWRQGGAAVAAEGGFGAAVGLLFAAYHVVRRDYLLAFPALQRAPFYRFKTSLPRCATSAATFGCVTSLLWSLLLRPLLLPLLAAAATTATGIPLPSLSPPSLSLPALLLALPACAYSTAFLAFAWESAAVATDIFLTHRHLFLPAPSSPASPIAPLLLALSPPPSSSPSFSAPPSVSFLSLPSPPSLHRLIFHWAFLDLSLLAESEADTWRRAALFESQDVYSVIVSACILPIDNMTVRVAAAAGYPTVTSTLQQQSAFQSPMTAATGAGFASANGLRWRQGRGGGEGQEGQAPHAGGIGGSSGYGGFGGADWNGGRGSDPGAAGAAGRAGMGVGGVGGRRRGAKQPNAAEVFFDWQLCAMSIRALAALTAASRAEDRLGVAQMSGASAAALSSLLSALLALDALLLAPSHHHTAAPATFSGFGEASSQATPSGFSQRAFFHQTSGLASGTGGLFGTPTLGLRFGSTEPGASSVSAVGAGDAAVSRTLYGEGLVGPVWGEAWAMADVVRTALYRIGETFGEEMVEKGGGGGMGGGRAGSSWKVGEAWLPGDTQPLFGSREAHAAKLLSLLRHTDHCRHVLRCGLQRRALLMSWQP
ncbi:hypothetical protein CLOP_g22297 [Closterium sp. NIES-67]|nr:hypothetical protein CLOP_g22297 [Closterium sp. NIES-67]